MNAVVGALRAEGKAVSVSKVCRWLGVRGRRAESGWDATATKRQIDVETTDNG